MLFPPLYVLFYFYLSLVVSLPISLILGGYLFWRARKEVHYEYTLLDDGDLEEKTIMKRSALVLALISFVKAYGISVLTLFGAFVLLLFVAIVINTLGHL